ncbi:acyl carrier protein [Acetobacterium wieringae]|uniref:acyl carrier protein n=1 Tax=Acetobacterium wieringae TaxID=52694 RepID=UPI002B205499|nr:acyl carrier protein [Acetobacterium wieringae]MEA4804370.1 acyl carrier protein [Acetobacterium wieringae]
MKRKDIFDKVEVVFRDVFDDENLNISEDTNSEDIEDWDSLEHINLIVAMETVFKLKFNITEVAELKNVGEMIDLIEYKIMNDE